MNEISENQLQIFFNAIESCESGICENLAVIDTFEINEDKFYMVRYEGKFPGEHEQTLAYLYALFYEGSVKAAIKPNQNAAMLIGLLEYMKETGKKLPQK